MAQTTWPQDDQPQFGLPDMDEAAMAQYWPACQLAVLSCFPDMCPEYLTKVAASFNWDSEQIITSILDQQEKGRPYPTQQNTSKRKRADSCAEASNLKNNFEKDDTRLANKGDAFVRRYNHVGRYILTAAFPQVYTADIDAKLKENNFLFYRTYLALDEAISGNFPAIRTKKTAKAPMGYTDAYDNSKEDADKMVIAEFRAAKSFVEAKRAEKSAAEQRERDELDNFACAQAEGTTADCGCCFDEVALNRMVHCDGETMHWFCYGCAKQMAETQVGLSKYQLSCMSIDGCKAEFPPDQKRKFLDEKLTIALERLEQETVLRLAGLENLAKCPFCPYAAEYPPIEENKEFRCENPECMMVSCRLCDEKTHIPQTCEEVAREIGHTARHRIEEAMSEALIRKCNKCKTPFIKEQGCNKMTCTAPGCGNTQCYVCHKSCDYSHFNDATRGGKKGNCPLFEEVEKRHDNEVKAAEERVKKVVVEENPDVDAALFDFAFSEAVKADDQRRKRQNPGPAPQRPQPRAEIPRIPQRPRDGRHAGQAQHPGVAHVVVEANPPPANRPPAPRPPVNPPAVNLGAANPPHAANNDLRHANDKKMPIQHERLWMRLAELAGGAAINPAVDQAIHAIRVVNPAVFRAQQAARMPPLRGPINAAPLPAPDQNPARGGASVVNLLSPPRAARPGANYQARQPRPLPIIDLTGEGDIYDFRHHQGANMGHAA